MDTSKALPLDLTAVQVDDELLDALGVDPAPAGPDAALIRVLVTWCLDMHAEPIPMLVDVDTALAIVRARSRRSPARRVADAVRRLIRGGR